MKLFISFVMQIMFYKANDKFRDVNGVSENFLYHLKYMFQKIIYTITVVQGVL